MYEAYRSYLVKLNNELKEKGIDLNLNLDCDATHVVDEVDILEHYLYFNKVLVEANASGKIDSLCGVSLVSLSDYIKSNFSKNEGVVDYDLSTEVEHLDIVPISDLVSKYRGSDKFTENQELNMTQNVMSILGLLGGSFIV